MKPNAPSSFLPELVSGRGTARRSRVVEGQARTRFGNDPAQDRIKVPENLGRRNPQRRNPATSQPGIPSRIARRSLPKTMRLAIHLDREPCIAAVEIETERTGRMLVTKLEPGRPLAQFSPQQRLGQAHRTTPRSRSLHGVPAPFRRMILEHRTCPSTMLRMVPLPETSSGRN
jgi:hypothetical protein